VTVPGQIPQEKRIELFEAYCDRQSIQYVARVCSVSPTTALRYKRLDGWDERLKGITRKAEEKIDDSIAEMRARQAKQAKQARAMQAKACLI
jgi:alpha-D-ribose 1-methylphosphonate 5-triphosphate diphosphatase PhnM